VRLIALSLLLLGLLASPAGAVQPNDDVAVARAEFERGEYHKVVSTLTPQLYPRTLIRDEEKLKEAHYLLGVSHYYLAHRDLARQEFIALLYLDPTRSLDPATESPEVYAFFESLKTEKRQQLEELQKQRFKEEEAKRRPSREVLVERTIHEVSPWGNFVPFGYGQFRNKQAAKGWFFLISESLLASTSVALFSYQAVTYGIPSRYPPTTTSAAERDAIRTRQVIQVAAGGAFLVLYLYGVIDAFSNQPPRVVTKRTERPLTLGPRGPELTPMVTAEAVGLGAMWRF